MRLHYKGERQICGAPHMKSLMGRRYIPTSWHRVVADEGQGDDGNGFPFFIFTVTRKSKCGQRGKRIDNNNNIKKREEETKLNEDDDFQNRL